MGMGLPALEKRVRALEQALFGEARGRQCNCRSGRETSYHRVAELEEIVNLRCPVHDVRDLGYLRWTPSGMPLRPEDRDFCSCPPCTVREFLQGERGPLTEEEQQAEKQRWEKEYAEASHEEFRREQARGGVLPQRSQQKKRS